MLGPKRPGRKVAYTGDTAYSEDYVEYIKNADVLIHDATGDESISHRMHIYGHSTAREAAEIARKAGVKKLVLFHISPRYKDSTTLLEEARMVFRETVVAEDFMHIDIKPH